MFVIKIFNQSSHCGSPVSGRSTRDALDVTSMGSAQQESERHRMEVRGRVLLPQLTHCMTLGE